MEVLFLSKIQEERSFLEEHDSKEIQLKKLEVQCISNVKTTTKISGCAHYQYTTSRLRETALKLKEELSSGTYMSPISTWPTSPKIRPNYTETILPQSPIRLSKYPNSKQKLLNSREDWSQRRIL